jgi:hypothetical protein
MDLELRLLDAIQHATPGLGRAGDEYAFQAALAAALRDADRELRCSFAAATRTRLRPPQDAIDALAGRTSPRTLAPEGRDPCSSRAKLDILWHSPVGPCPIELKYCANWKADSNGYQFLKDLYRLERMVSAGPFIRLSDVRLAAFVTRESVYWLGRKPEPRPFWLTEGRQIDAGYWVQYDQTSADTLWFSYPPFFLANSYTLNWYALHDDWKCLLVRVAPQSAR